jgi:hypothetical protein
MFLIVQYVVHNSYLIWQNYKYKYKIQDWYKNLRTILNKFYHVMQST